MRKWALKEYLKRNEYVIVISLFEKVFEM